MGVRPGLPLPAASLQCASGEPRPSLLPASQAFSLLLATKNNFFFWEDCRVWIQYVFNICIFPFYLCLAWIYQQPGVFHLWKVPGGGRRTRAQVTPSTDEPAPFCATRGHCPFSPLPSLEGTVFGLLMHISVVLTVDWAREDLHAP